MTPPVDVTSTDGLATVNGNGAVHSEPATGNKDKSGYDEDDQIPERLLQVQDQQTGLIHGRSPAMVKYLLQKAKHKFILEEREQLEKDWTNVNEALNAERDLKEQLLDDVMRKSWGSVNHFLQYAVGMVSDDPSFRQPAAKFIDPTPPPPPPKKHSHSQSVGQLPLEGVQ
jgi:hypothetical protein